MNFWLVLVCEIALTQTKTNRPSSTKQVEMFEF